MAGRANGASPELCRYSRVWEKLLWRETAACWRGTPVSRRGTPVSRRGTPVSRRGTPVSRRGTPVSRRGTPVSRRGIPVSRRGSGFSAWLGVLGVNQCTFVARGTPRSRNTPSYMNHARSRAAQPAAATKAACLPRRPKLPCLPRRPKLPSPATSNTSRGSPTSSLLLATRSATIPIQLIDSRTYSRSGQLLAELRLAGRRPAGWLVGGPPAGWSAAHRLAAAGWLRPAGQSPPLLTRRPHFPFPAT